jgi:hypothetical protein
MGFLQRLFGPKQTNPTLGFPPVSPSFRLVWDSGSHRLNGIAYGAPVEDLAPLGPCDEFKALNEYFSVFTYLSLGLELSMGFDGLAHIEFFLENDNPDEGPPGMRCARPLIEPGGIELTPDTSPHELADHFGEPEAGSQDDNEIVVLYRSGSVLYELCVSRAGRLKGIDISDTDR